MANAYINATGTISNHNQLGCVIKMVCLWARLLLSLASLGLASVADRVSPPIPKACEPPHDVYLFCDASLPLDQRLDDLIGRLTLEEKPYLLVARESPKGNISRLGIPECK